MAKGLRSGNVKLAIRPTEAQFRAAMLFLSMVQCAHLSEIKSILRGQSVSEKDFGIKFTDIFKTVQTVIADIN